MRYLSMETAAGQEIQIDREDSHVELVIDGEPVELQPDELDRICPDLALASIDAGRRDRGVRGGRSA